MQVVFSPFSPVGDSRGLRGSQHTLVKNASVILSFQLTASRPTGRALLALKGRMSSAILREPEMYSIRRGLEIKKCPLEFSLGFAYRVAYMNVLFYVWCFFA